MATTTYPPGTTFLDTLKRSFADVPVNKEKDNAIATTEFLEAAESLTTLFGRYSLFQVQIQNWILEKEERFQGSLGRERGRIGIEGCRKRSKDPTAYIM
jgi:hypothetical protein